MAQQPPAGQQGMAPIPPPRGPDYPGYTQMLVNGQQGLMWTYVQTTAAPAQPQPAQPAPRQRRKQQPAVQQQNRGGMPSWFWAIIAIITLLFVMFMAYSLFTYLAGRQWLRDAGDIGRQLIDPLSDPVDPLSDLSGPDTTAVPSSAIVPESDYSVCAEVEQVIGGPVTTDKVGWWAYVPHSPTTRVATGPGIPAEILPKGIRLNGFRYTNKECRDANLPGVKGE
jgi:hypothetical protein